MVQRLTEVAEKVGVSEATVSRVLNGRPGVSAATRTAVLTALDVLGYERPTKLRGSRARLVGLVLPELGNPIFPALAEVVGGALAQLRFTPVLCASGPNGLSEADYVNMLLDQHASGVIFAGGNFAEADSSHVHYQLLRDRALPVVLVNASSDDLAFAQVSTDDAVATEQAFNHLQTLGHEEVGMILGPEDHMPSRLRLEAFETLTRRGAYRRRPVARRARPILPRSWSRRRSSPGKPGHNGDYLRQRPLGPGSRPGCTQARAACPRGCFHRRLRRLYAHDVHRSSAHDHPPTHRVDGPRRGKAAGQPDRRDCGHR